MELPATLPLPAVCRAYLPEWYWISNSLGSEAAQGCQEGRGVSWPLPCQRPRDLGGTLRRGQWQLRAQGYWEAEVPGPGGEKRERDVLTGVSPGSGRCFCATVALWVPGTLQRPLFKQALSLDSWHQP